MPQVYTPKLLGSLAALNREVNADVTWASDMEVYGVPERWGVPLPQPFTGKIKGDCDKNAFEKGRRAIHQLSLPAEDLQPMCCYVGTSPEDAKSAGALRMFNHMEMTVPMTQGDIAGRLILSSLMDSVFQWDAPAFRKVAWVMVLIDGVWRYVET